MDLVRVEVPTGWAESRSTTPAGAMRCDPPMVDELTAAFDRLDTIPTWARWSSPAPHPRSGWRRPLQPRRATVRACPDHEGPAGGPLPVADGGPVNGPAVGEAEPGAPRATCAWRPVGPLDTRFLALGSTPVRAHLAAPSPGRAPAAAARRCCSARSSDGPTPSGSAWPACVDDDVLVDEATAMPPGPGRPATSASGSGDEWQRRRCSRPSMRRCRRAAAQLWSLEQPRSPGPRDRRRQATGNPRWPSLPGVRRPGGPRTTALPACRTNLTDGRSPRGRRARRRAGGPARGAGRSGTGPRGVLVGRAGRRARPDLSGVRPTPDHTAVSPLPGGRSFRRRPPPPGAGQQQRVVRLVRPRPRPGRPAHLDAPPYPLVARSADGLGRRGRGLVPALARSGARGGPRAGQRLLPAPAADRLVLVHDGPQGSRACCRSRPAPYGPGRRAHRTGRRRRPLGGRRERHRPPGQHRGAGGSRCTIGRPAGCWVGWRPDCPATCPRPSATWWPWLQPDCLPAGPPARSTSPTSARAPTAPSRLPEDLEPSSPSTRAPSHRTSGRWRCTPWAAGPSTDTPRALAVIEPAREGSTSSSPARRPSSATCPTRVVATGEWCSRPHVRAWSRLPAGSGVTYRVPVGPSPLQPAGCG